MNLNVDKSLKAQGKWEDTQEYITTADGSIDIYKCSNCGKNIAIVDYNNYCPNCGADMRYKED